MGKRRVRMQPGAVALSASSRQFQFYKSGTLKKCCDNDSCNEDTVPINHAVTVVGYSEGSSDKKYWKLQNSWGKSWGDNGFIKLEIQDGSGVCRINHYGVQWAEWDYDSSKI